MSISHIYHGHLPIRLNKWMAELGLCSRREAEALIAQGGVCVDNVPVEQPGHKIETGQTLTLTTAAEQAIASKFTAILNKPVGYVSAQPEDDHIPAVRLLYRSPAIDGTPKPPSNTQMAPLGRLDRDSRGLLLLSEDGVLAKAIIGPQHSLEKEYIVKVSGKITTGRITLLRNGLSLDERRLKPAKVTQISDDTLRFILKEGRKRQIRRMCALVGLKVVDLLRVRIGTLNLFDLPEGQWRLLTEAERAALIKAAEPPKVGKKVSREARPRAPAKARRAPRKPSPEKLEFTQGKPGPKRTDTKTSSPDQPRKTDKLARKSGPSRSRSGANMAPDATPQAGPRRSDAEGRPQPRRRTENASERRSAKPGKDSRYASKSKPQKPRKPRPSN